MNKHILYLNYILYIYRSAKFIWRKLRANILAPVFTFPAKATPIRRTAINEVSTSNWTNSSWTDARSLTAGDISGTPIIRRLFFRARRSFHSATLPQIENLVKMQRPQHFSPTTQSAQSRSYIIFVHFQTSVYRIYFIQQLFGICITFHINSLPEVIKWRNFTNFSSNVTVRCSRLW